MRFAVLGVFATLLSVAVATSFTLCSTPDHLGVTAVTLSEDPVKPGTDLKVTVSGKPDVTITSGKLVLTVSASEKTLLTEDFDICTQVGITCPVAAGSTFTASVTEAIPRFTPAVTATAQVVAYDGSGNKLSCISVQVTVLSSNTAPILSEEAVNFLLKEQFEDFKIKFNKKYDSPEEESIRFNNFKISVERVAFKNKYESNVFGITKFSDLTQEEFKNTYLNYKPNHQGLNLPVHPVPKGSIPANYDWRDYGVVTAVKNQGFCGSCWAFSAVETIESAWAKKGNTLTTFSEQQVIACDTTDAGCRGGDTITAYAYVEKAGGLATEADYPYASSIGISPKCKSNFTISGGKISGYTYATPKCTLTCNNQDEDTLAKNLHGTAPVSICVDASSWSDYTSGVYKGSSCSNSYSSLDHCVQLVGYHGYTGSASDSSDGYWIVRNSWDTTWGVKGYIYLEMGTNACGIADEATLVTIA